MGRRSDLSIGDTVLVYDSFVGISYSGVVEALLATQFTYQPKSGSLRFASYLVDKWKITDYHIEEEPCEPTSDQVIANLDDAAKALWTGSEQLGLSIPVLPDVGTQRQTGLPPTSGPDCASHLALTPRDDKQE